MTKNRLQRYDFDRMMTRDGVAVILYKCAEDGSEYAMPKREYISRGKPHSINLRPAQKRLQSEN